jgi:hypothetical protein
MMASLKNRLPLLFSLILILVVLALASSNSAAPFATPPPASSTMASSTPTSPEPPRGSYCGGSASGDILVPPTSTPPAGTQIETPQPLITPLPSGQYDLTGLSTRAGFGMVPFGSAPEPWAAVLKAGWYVNWNVEKRFPSQLPELWQTIRVHQNCIYPSMEYIQWVEINYPGSVWIVGNEPDVIWQDNTLPEDYAHIYHDAYTAIKQADPTARVAVGAISQGTPLRLAYLDRVLAEYQKKYNQKMPADWWTVHGYVLREQHKSWGVEIPPGFTEDHGMLWEISDHSRLDLFKQDLVAFRQWMANNGYRNTPLALTEFGILMPPEYGFPIDQVSQYMQDTFHWLQTAQDSAIGDPKDNNLLIQRWAWFALDCIDYPSPNLEDIQTGELTLLGTTFRDYILAFHP